MILRFNSKTLSFIPNQDTKNLTMTEGGKHRAEWTSLLNYYYMNECIGTCCNEIESSLENTGNQNL